MKNYDKIKTLQLIIFIALTVIGLIAVFADAELYHMIAANRSAMLLFGILWLMQVLSFVFMFFDFSSYSTLKREYSELDLAIFSDPITGMANRSSCDAFIEQYLDKPLPKDIGCITLEIINLREINSKHGHKNGNNAIRDFSAILASCAQDVCFVGRNGGNKFLALFTECSDEKMDVFLDNVNERILRHNEKKIKGGFSQIEYKYGKAFDEGESVNSINELISLSNRRSIESYRTFAE